MAARNVNYFVCSGGTPALPEPAGYLTTSSKATTLQELKRDLAGKSTVPTRKFDVLIATGQGTWAADGFYDQLPEGPLHVQIVPLGQPTEVKVVNGFIVAFIAALVVGMAPSLRL